MLGEGLGINSKNPIKIEDAKEVKYVSSGLKHAVGVTVDNTLIV